MNVFLQLQASGCSMEWLQIGFRQGQGFATLVNRGKSKEVE